MTTLKIEHITQPAILVPNLDAAMDWMHEAFAAFPSERSRISSAGVNTAVYALNNRTNLELVEPYDRESAAYRLLQRTGPGWHMLSVDIEQHNYAELDAAVRATGFRVVQHTPPPSTAWHLHPRDTHGVLLMLGDRPDHDDLAPWAGHAWRAFSATNTRVIDAVAGISITVEDDEAAQITYGKLGLVFDVLQGERGDDILEAVTPRGTIFQIRKGVTEESDAGRWLQARGPGLYHLILAARSLDTVRARLSTIGARFVEDTPDRLISDPANTLGIPIEFRPLPS